MTAELAHMPYPDQEQDATPLALEAEQCVLGFAMAYPRTVPDFASVLQPDHFSEPLHVDIWEVILQRYRENEPFWPEFVGRDLKHHPAWVQGLDLSYIARLARHAREYAAPPDALYFAQMVIEAAYRRAIITVVDETRTDLFFDMEVTAEDIADRLSTASTSVGQGFVGATKRQDSLLSAVGSYLTATDAPRTSTGLVALDDVLVGLETGDITIIAGRPSMGKTALALYLAFKAAMRGEPVLFFSLEMTLEQVGQRLASLWLAEHGLQIPYHEIRKYRAGLADLPKVMEALETIDALPIEVIEARGLSVAAIRADAMRHRMQYAMKGKPLKLVVIDYLQLVAWPKGENNPVQATSRNSAEIKTIAGHLDVPVVLLSQLSRQVEQRDNKRPLLSDLRESGAIEQDADNVIFMYREHYYKKRERPKSATLEADWRVELRALEHTAEAILAKNRHGPTDTVHLGCDMPTNRFWDANPGTESMAL